MDYMLNDNEITFKEIEQEVFKMFCEKARDFTRKLLEQYDLYLMEDRDKKAYRHRGIRNTTVKTVYGEVSYGRRLYETTRDDGIKETVYLLDEQLCISNVGLISQNMAEQLVSGITEMSYRECAAKISSMTGQSISSMGVWNVIQSLGESVADEEAELIRAHKKGLVYGETVTPVLFEEVDGVYISLQREKNSKAEMKAAIAYSGWEEKSKGRYGLKGTVAVAGFSGTKEFSEYKEAAIAEKYNTDEINIRLINGDGAPWIKKTVVSDAVFQLDPFHRNKAIRQNIPYRKAVNDIYSYLDNKDTDGLFEYLKTYKNSLSEDEEIEKAEELIKYFRSNKDGLLPYNARNLEIPVPPEGVRYRNMGTMENHIWSIIARRMKHNHASWSIRGGNNLAKILARKGSGRLNEVVARLKIRGFERTVIEEITKEVLTAGRVPKKEGNGYAYPVSGHLRRLENSTGITRQMLLSFIG